MLPHLLENRLPVVALGGFHSSFGLQKQKTSEVVSKYKPGVSLTQVEGLVLDSPAFAAAALPEPPPQPGPSPTGDGSHKGPGSVLCDRRVHL